MSGLALWLIVLAAPPAEAAVAAPDAATEGDAAEPDALDAAILCYEELDYTCADTRLAEALASDLAGARRAQAHLYEALLALAWRDRIRARRAVRALLAIDPEFDPGPVPPPLQALFDDERPDPPAPPALTARLDGRWLPVSGQDAEQWTSGLGVELAGGVLLDRQWAFEVSVAYTDFAPALFTLQGLTMWQASAGAGWRTMLGPLALQVGVEAGAAWIAVDGTLVDDDYMAVAAAAPIDLSWPIWRGLGVGLRFAPLLLTTTTGDQAAVSYILPLSAGLRFVDEPP